MSSTSSPTVDPRASLFWVSVVGIYLFSVACVAAYWLVEIFPCPVPVADLARHKPPAIGQEGAPSEPQHQAPSASARASSQAEDAGQENPALPSETDATINSQDVPRSTLRDASPVADPDALPEAPAPQGRGAADEDRGPSDLDGVMTNRWKFPSIQCGARRVPLRYDQGSILLALLAGVLGSFIHAAQSLAAYVGNRELRSSWLLWYFLRPVIGAILGTLFYFVTRAGLVSADSASVNPYGIVSFGALAGWFSKQATDKLAETFETLFRTQKPVELKHRLGESMHPVRITKITPDKVPAGSQVDIELVVEGEGFAANALALLASQPLPTEFVSTSSLKIKLPATSIPAQGSAVGQPVTLDIMIENPATPVLPVRRSEVMKVEVT